jgi:Coenzyme PQQ synthesis protein D (PqqD)
VEPSLNLSIDDRVRRRDDVLWRLGRDQVVVRRVGADGLDLSGAAAMVWVALDEPRSIAELAGEVGSLLDLEGAVAQASVADAVHELMAASLIVADVVVEGPA